MSDNEKIFCEDKGTCTSADEYCYHGHETESECFKMPAEAQKRGTSLGQLDLIVSPNKQVVMEGLLSVKRHDYYTPIDCSCGCDPNKSFIPPLIGGVTSADGATSLHALHKTLEALNGKQVKITVEWG